MHDICFIYLHVSVTELLVTDVQWLRLHSTDFTHDTHTTHRIYILPETMQQPDLNQVLKIQ